MLYRGVHTTSVLLRASWHSPPLPPTRCTPYAMLPRMLPRNLMGVWRVGGGVSPAMPPEVPPLAVVSGDISGDEGARRWIVAAWIS